MNILPGKMNRASAPLPVRRAASSGARRSGGNGPNFGNVTNAAPWQLDSEKLMKVYTDFSVSRPHPRGKTTMPTPDVPDALTPDVPTASTSDLLDVEGEEQRAPCWIAGRAASPSADSASLPWCETPDLPVQQAPAPQRFVRAGILRPGYGAFHSRGNPWNMHHARNRAPLPVEEVVASILQESPMQQEIWDWRECGAHTMSPGVCACAAGRRRRAWASSPSRP